jgi:hypothetical protein
MKKKLLEQKEKAIIESFAKTFNKIKRLDENEVGTKPKSITVKVLPEFIDYIKSIKDEESRNTGFIANSTFELYPKAMVKIASGPFEMKMFRQMFFWAQYQPEHNEITLSKTFCFGNKAITKHNDLKSSPVGAPQMNFGDISKGDGCTEAGGTYCKFENGFDVGQKDHRGYFEIIAVKNQMDENYMDETYEEPWADLTINSNDLFYDPQYRATYEIYKLDPNSNDTNLKVYSDTDTSFIKTNTNILKKKIHDGKLVKVKEIITSANSGLDYSKWEKFKDTNPSNYNQKPEDQFMEKYPVGSQFKDARYGAIKTIKKYQGKDVFIEDEDMPGRLFQWPLLHLIQGVSKKEFIPVEQPVDEINIPKVLAPVAFAAGMMGASKDVSGQAITPQQSHQVSLDTTTALPDNDYKAGRVILNSYNKNPFTADMWSKQSRENMRLFKAVKKLADYYSSGGQIEDSDLSHLGAEARRSSVATDFLQRQDNKTARLEEDEDPTNYNDFPHENFGGVYEVLDLLDHLISKCDFSIEKMSKTSTSNEPFSQGVIKGVGLIKSYIEDYKKRYK